VSRFVRATKFAAKLKLAFIGPAGSGKTYSALAVGCHLAKLIGTRVAVIDSERGSASLYAGDFDFDVLELASFSPMAYVEAIKDAEKEGYGVIIVDSLSHAWTGKEGALAQVDQAAKREQGNTFAAWRHVTPMHNMMVDALVSSTSHLIATMRVKTEYVLEKNERTGKTAPRKVGMQPVQRDGLEYVLRDALRHAGRLPAERGPETPRKSS
jgi:KaiC/GvpD/RAD55 family RecA-like ATPase